MAGEIVTYLDRCESRLLVCGMVLDCAPLMPGLEPAFKICDLFDPGTQPHVAAYSDWHGRLPKAQGAILNVLLDWGLIWAARLPFRKHFQRSDVG